MNDDGYLYSNTYYSCHSDWPVLLRYARKIDVEIHFVNDEAKCYVMELIWIMKSYRNIC